MTRSPKLTPKEWIILKLFIIREGFALEDVRRNPRRKQLGVDPRKMAPDHFYSYPDDIVALLTQEIAVDQKEKTSYYSDFYETYVKDVSAVTIPTAGKACRKFVDLGIFERIEGKRTEKKFQETTQYFLKSDYESFKIVLLFLMQNCDAYERVEMLSHPYFRKKITEDLVRTRLFEMHVSIISRIDIFDWAPDEIPIVLSIFDREKKGIEGKFEREVRDAIRQYETDQLFINDEASDWVFPFFGQYHIPVFPEGMSIDEKLKIVITLHPSYDAASKCFNRVITQFPDVFDYQFKTVEQEELILPLLGLIQSSPAALAEFILGKWESFKFSHGLFHKKDESFENPLFMRLISIAISDMASTLKIPGNKNVDSFELRKISNHHSINGEYCQEDALLRIGLTREYDIYYDMGYSTRDRKYPHPIFPIIEDKTPDPKKFWVKIKVKQVSPFFIRRPDIKDVTLLLTLLRASSHLSDHIRGKLSNRMQNLLLRYDNNEPGIAFTKFLIEEINRALLREDFYDPKAFSNIKLSENTKESIDGYLRVIEFDDDSTGSDDKYLLMRNRYLLDDAFSQAIARFGDVQYPIKK